MGNSDASSSYEQVGGLSIGAGAAGARPTWRPLALVPRLVRPRSEANRAPAKIRLMGVPIDCVTQRQVIDAVIAGIRNGRGGWIVTPNVDHLRVLSKRPDLLAMLSEATFMVADGMPLIWASRLKRTPLPERVPGASLILTLTAAAARSGASVFLLGGNPGEAEATATVLTRLNPTLKVAGTACPRFGFDSDPAQMSDLTRDLQSARPDIVYTCLGFPKDPLVIRVLREGLPSAWFVGLGGSLAIVSGRTPRAPRWIQNVGFEWLWRLGLEPRRLFRRYLIEDLPFALRLLGNSLVER